MTTWNYRIIDHGDYLALHEVYYGEDGKPRSYTAGPVQFVSDAGQRDDLIGSLLLAVDCAKAADKPVLTLADFPPPDLPDDWPRDATGKPALTAPFRPERHIETGEDVVFYLEAALEGRDPAHVLDAVQTVVDSPAWAAHQALRPPS